MTPSPKLTVLISPPHVQWAVDADQIVVVDSSRARLYFLQGVEAALWGWLALSYSYPKLIDMLGSLLGVPPAEAEAALINIIHGWETARLLQREAVD